MFTGAKLGTLRNNLQCDYSNQGRPTKFSANLTNKVVEVNNSFPTNYPKWPQICCLCNVQLDRIDNLLKTIFILFSTIFIFLNLWKEITSLQTMTAETHSAIKKCLLQKYNQMPWINRAHEWRECRISLPKYASTFLI